MTVGRVAALVFAALFVVAAAPEPVSGRYNPRETFAPFDLGQAPNVYRSASGLPGPQYWENRPDYRIAARLDTAAHSISGTVEIRYANNSPDTLDALWLLLEQNRYLPDSRGNFSSGDAPSGYTEGMKLDSVGVQLGEHSVSVEPLITDTRAQIRLPAPLPHGGKVTLRIAYHYMVPKEPWGGRTGWMTSPHGDIYSIAQWYPRMAVYDDVRGWDTLPYLAQEFYLEYGDFDYSITIPANYVIAGSGELANPAEVLTPAERSRLAQSRSSDRTVLIHSSSEPFGSPSATRTWHFTMHDSRDVAWAASPAFTWDAARIRLPDGHSSMAMSF